MKRWEKFKDYQFKGDWHVHTNWTDGRSNIREMFDKAVENKLDFIAFTEHVRRNLDYEYLKFKEEVYRVGSAFNIKYAVGCEAKVLDIYGNLDINKNVVRESELILFSFHSSLFKTKSSYFEAVLNAIENPISDIWAHPTSYNEKMGFPFSPDEVQQIASTLYANNVCFEINLKYMLPTKKFMKQLLNEGNVPPIVLSSDAHHTRFLLNKNKIEEIIAKYTLGWLRGTRRLL